MQSLVEELLKFEKMQPYELHAGQPKDCERRVPVDRLLTTMQVRDTVTLENHTLGRTPLERW